MLMIREQRVAVAIVGVLLGSIASAGEPDASLEAELKKAKGSSAVLLRPSSASLFARLQARAHEVAVESVGQSLVSHAAGTCAADAKESRAPWCDEFTEADLRKNQKAWLDTNLSEYWSLHLSREMHTVGDYNFKTKRFTFSFVPNWCDIEAFMCLTSQLEGVSRGMEMALVVGAYEQGEKRLSAHLSFAADEDQARLIAGLRDTSIPSHKGSVGELQVIFRVTGRSRRIPLRATELRAEFPFVFTAVTPVALQVTSDDTIVLQHFF